MRTPRLIRWLKAVHPLSAVAHTAVTVGAIVALQALAHRGALW